MCDMTRRENPEVFSFWMYLATAGLHIIGRTSLVRALRETQT